MKNRKLLLCLALSGTFLVSGCSNVDLAMGDKQEEASEDSSQENGNEVEADETDTVDSADNSSKDSSDEANEDDKEGDDAENDSDTEDESSNVDYRVIAFFDEELDSIPVSVVKTGTFDDGEVYSYDIVYDEDIEDSFGDMDRLHIGSFLVKEDEIYLITDTEDDHEEQDFYDYGVLVYAEEDYSDEISGYEIKLHNDGYLCRCSYYDTTVETGYYAEFVFNSDKELTYFRSGYGAEADPIEITTNTDIEDAFSKAKETDRSEEDFTVSYNGFDIGPDTTYQEIIDALGYPEHFEENNNGFVSAEDGYRWELSYPDASEHGYNAFDVRIVCVSPSNDPEGPDTYIDFVYFTCPTYRDVAIEDSIYSLVDIYGAPDEIRESSCPGFTEVVYEFNGNELEFTIMPDYTIRFLRIHFAK